MGHLSQIEAVMEAYDDILYHYPDDGEDTFNMPKKEVIAKQKADFNYWAIHSGVCMPEIDLEHEFEREAIKGLDDFIETAHIRHRDGFWAVNWNLMMFWESWLSHKYTSY
ncbi:hypothetical protein FOC1_g10008308 [Fusarium oxysporum f. sp. cubense race 1]|uniref:Uncharacterized protein n=1 Tax=Fusarium oxysporum f. sp. cubense (strain race 1) TaxID=1229664 RepID=N4UBV3_FUSC1|nr:hypothetical protein FOC1_g10008308 [Fusarium oxysporum f. sp. cubense race 1]